MNGTRAVRVRARKVRYTFDGETGILILANTQGEVLGMTIDAKLPRHNKPALTVFWDAAIAQNAGNDEPTVVSGWEDSDVSPHDVEFVEHFDRPE